MKYLKINQATFHIITGFEVFYALCCRRHKNFIRVLKLCLLGKRCSKVSSSQSQHLYQVLLEYCDCNQDVWKAIRLFFVLALVQALDELCTFYGPVLRLWLGKKLWICLSDPADIAVSNYKILRRWTYGREYIDRVRSPPKKTTKNKGKK